MENKLTCVHYERPYINEKGVLILDCMKIEGIYLYCYFNMDLIVFY